MELDNICNRIVDVTRRLGAILDSAQALANAMLHLEVFEHIVVARMGPENYLTYADRSGSNYEGGKLPVWYFVSYERPSIGPSLDMLGRSIDSSSISTIFVSKAIGHQSEFSRLVIPLLSIWLAA